MTLSTAELQEGNPPKGAIVHEEVLSLVAEKRTGVGRTLPTLWLGGGAVYTAVDTTSVLARLVTTANYLVTSFSEPIYALTTCSYKGKRGLYGGDLHNRSAFRFKLKRQGFTFEDDSFSRLREDGKWSSASCESFDPQFLVLFINSMDSDEVIRTTGAQLLFGLQALRLGKPTVDDFTRLRAGLGQLTAIGVGRPELLAKLIADQIA